MNIEKKSTKRVPDDDQNLRPSPAPPLNRGDNNNNPSALTFLQLLKEDYVTYDRSLLELGLWAVWTHRFGNWRMGIRSKIIRMPFSMLYKMAYYWITWFWGIKLDYTVKLGRRVRIWHHGGMILGAREIGDDVHLRQNTTLGLADRRDLNAKPVIGSGVEIGTGAVILGYLKVGDGAIIGANAVVTRDVPPFTLVGGVPAKFIKSLRPQSTGKPDEQHPQSSDNHQQ